MSTRISAYLAHGGGEGDESGVDASGCGGFVSRFSTVGTGGINGSSSALKSVHGLILTSS